MARLQKVRQEIERTRALLDAFDKEGVVDELTGMVLAPCREYCEDLIQYLETLESFLSGHETTQLRTVKP